jgi:hypothetical protein
LRLLVVVVIDQSAQMPLKPEGWSVVDAMIEFLRAIGLDVHEGELADPTILPGLTIQHGVVVVDRLRLSYPGDLLHEAGHLAIKLPSDRAVVNYSAGNDPAEEMMAMAWAWAAGRHIGIAPDVIFHDASYKGLDGSSLAEQFTAGQWFGVPMLQAYGFTSEPRNSARLKLPAYPAMARWVRRENDLVT